MSKEQFNIPLYACCANCLSKDDCQLKMQVEIGYKESEKWRLDRAHIHCCLCWQPTLAEKSLTGGKNVVYLS